MIKLNVGHKYTVKYYSILSEVRSLSRAQLFATPWIAACTKLLRPWDFQDKSTGVGCHFLLQGIFPTQGSNPGLSQCRQTLYCLTHQGSPIFHARTSTIKKRNVSTLRKQKRLRRGGKNRQKNYTKKDVNDQDNYDGFRHSGV